MTDAENVKKLAIAVEELRERVAGIIPELGSSGGRWSLRYRINDVISDVMDRIYIRDAIDLLFDAEWNETFGVGNTPGASLRSTSSKGLEEAVEAGLDMICPAIQLERMKRSGDIHSWEWRWGPNRAANFLVVYRLKTPIDFVKIDFDLTKVGGTV